MLIILCDLKHHLFAFVIRHTLGKNPSLFGELAPVLRVIKGEQYKIPHRWKKPRGNQSLDQTCAGAGSI
jgi:1-acyl-sn-glycerol-3-phosphate acyltransferase